MARQERHREPEEPSAARHLKRDEDRSSGGGGAHEEEHPVAPATNHHEQARGRAEEEIRVPRVGGCREDGGGPEDPPARHPAVAEQRRAEEHEAERHRVVSDEIVDTADDRKARHDGGQPDDHGHPSLGTVLRGEHDLAGDHGRGEREERDRDEPARCVIDPEESSREAERDEVPRRMGERQVALVGRAVQELSVNPAVGLVQLAAFEPLDVHGIGRAGDDDPDERSDVEHCRDQQESVEDAAQRGHDSPSVSGPGDSSFGVDSVSSHMTTPWRDAELGGLEKRLGRRFVDRSLLTQALTHASWVHENPGAAFSGLRAARVPRGRGARFLRRRSRLPERAGGVRGGPDPQEAGAREHAGVGGRRAKDRSRPVLAPGPRRGGVGGAGAGLASGRRLRGGLGRDLPRRRDPLRARVRPSHLGRVRRRLGARSEDGAARALAGTSARHAALPDRRDGRSAPRPSIHGRGLGGRGRARDGHGAESQGRRAGGCGDRQAGE